MMQDDAGIFVAPPDGTCQLYPVETGAIQGFLNKGNCFIATATFGSVDAAPVAMLRKFRDEILLEFGLGRRFVDLYTSWSPPAAEWLLEHSEFRIVSLLFLAPVQILAWFCLHPLSFVLLCVLALISGIGLRILSSRRTHGGPNVGLDAG